MKKLIFLLTIIGFQVKSQDVVDLIRCTYYTNTENAVLDTLGQEAFFQIKYKENATVKMNGGSEYKFFCDDLKLKFLNKEISVIKCKDSVYLNLKKMNREFGYSLIRKSDTISYIKSFNEVSQKATTNAIMFGMIGAIATKYNETFLVLKNTYQIKEVINYDDLKYELKQLEDNTHLQNFKNENSWDINIAWKYYNIVKPYLIKQENIQENYKSDDMY